jgi:hypothetical protein
VTRVIHLTDLEHLSCLLLSLGSAISTANFIISWMVVFTIIFYRSKYTLIIRSVYRAVVKFPLSFLVFLRICDLIRFWIKAWLFVSKIKITIKCKHVKINCQFHYIVDGCLYHYIQQKLINVIVKISKFEISGADFHTLLIDALDLSDE